MNIASVSATNPADLQNTLAMRCSDFNSLQSALQSGNITGAQSAFAAFEQEVQKSVQAGGSTSIFGPGSQTSADLQHIGSALKSSDLAGAQSAFASLKQDLLSLGHVSTSNAIHSRDPHHRSHAMMIAGGVESVANANSATTAQAAADVLASRI